MKKKLTVVSDTVNACKTADDMEERISAITKIESDIYAVTVYDENGKIINCTGSGGKLRVTRKLPLIDRGEYYRAHSRYQYG